MFDLFELSSLLTYGKVDSKQKSTFNIHSHAYQDTTDRSIVCLNFSTESAKLFLWQREFGHEPSSCWLPWLPHSSILCMCIDPTGSWLLVLSSQYSMFVVPIRRILDPSALVDQLWSIDDITEIKIPQSLHGQVTCMTWWKTMCGDNVALLGTKVGFLVLVDLVQQTELLQLDLNEHIVNIELLHSDGFTSTHALVSTKSCNQWHVTLEEKLDLDLSVIQESAYFPIQSQYKTIYTPTKDSGETSKANFQPRRVQFPPHVSLSAQYAKGRHFITAQDLSNNVFQIYSSELNKTALFMYKLPTECDQVLYTDKLMFTSVSTEGTTLQILANTLAEISDPQEKDFSDLAVVQSFDLDPEEKILCMYKKCFPFYWHDRQELKRKEELVQHVQLKSHSVFDGCVIITSRAVYECRPRVSPERLFVTMCQNNSRINYLETLSILVGLDISQLAMQVAESKLKMADYAYADKLLSLAKASDLQRCLLYVKYGRHKESLDLATHLLSKEHKAHLSAADRQVLLDMCMKLLVAVTLESKDMAETSKLENALSHLLIHEKRDIPSDTWESLSNSGLYNILWKVARAKGRIGQVVDLHVQRRCLRLPNFLSTTTEHFAAPLWMTQVKLPGSLLEHLTGNDIIQLLETQPVTLTQLLDLVEECLHDLDPADLCQITKKIDPGQPEIMAFLHRFLRYRVILGPAAGDRVLDLVMLFMLSVLHLYAKVKIVPSATDVIKPLSQVTQDKGVLSSQPGLVSCSAFYTAVIIDHRLHVWGRAQVYYGQEVCEDANLVDFPGNPPMISVSCGFTHILALTAYGVYSWGENKHGQLGLSHKHSQPTPCRIAGLQHLQVVAIACGQYHSLALTEDGRVYTWGWNVHGQLGLGHITDVDVPTEVAALRSHCVIAIHGAQGHTVVLTRQGHVYTCGNNAFGQLGLGDTEKRTLPVRVNLQQPVRSVATRYFHNVCVTKNNQIYQWGLSPLSLKQKIVSSKKARNITPPPSKQFDLHQLPRLVANRNIHQNDEIVQVSCGADITVVLTASGRTYSWGRNHDGQLGVGVKTTRDEKFPVKVHQLDETKVRQVGCGPEYVLAMDREGQVWGWGRNDHGQLMMTTVRITDTMDPAYSCVFPVKLPLKGEPLKQTWNKQWRIDPMPKERKHLQALGRVIECANGQAVSIKHYVQGLEYFLNIHLLQRKSSQLSSHTCSAELSEYSHKYTEAFMYRLQALRQTSTYRQDPSLPVILGNTLKCITEENKDKHKQYAIVLSQLLDFWDSEDTSDLEAMLSTNLQYLAAPLVIYIDSQYQLGQAYNFSPVFMMQLTLAITSQLQNGLLPPGALQSQMQAPGAYGLSHSDGHMNGQLEVIGNVPVLAERMWWEITGTCQASPSTSGRDDSVSVVLKTEDVGKLDDIANANIIIQTDQTSIEDISGNSTASEHKNVTLFCDNSQASSKSSIAAVLFVCGHQLTKSEFTQEISSLGNENEYSSSTSYSSISLGAVQGNLNVLFSYYTRAVEKLACPSCVTDRLNALASNVK